MKLKRIFVTLLLCCMVMTTFVSAVDGEDPAVGDSGSEPEVTETESGSEPEALETEPEDNGPVYIIQESPPEPVGYSTFALNDPAARSGSSITSVVESIFGEYQPRTTTVTDHLADGSSVSYEQVVGGLAGMDWVWIASVCLFALVLYSFFRILGVFFRGC